MNNWYKIKNIHRHDRELCTMLIDTMFICRLILLCIVSALNNSTAVHTEWPDIPLSQSCAFILSHGVLTDKHLKQKSNSI